MGRKGTDNIKLCTRTPFALHGFASLRLVTSF